MFPIFVLVIAGLLAGGVNAIAGGGTLLSFPALVWLGVPAIMANATATLPALPDYIGSAWAYRDDIKAEGALHLRTIVMVAACGGLIGAGLLLATPGDAIQGHRCCGPVLSACGIGVVAAYGGYLNGGLGIMFLAVFGLIGFRDLHSMNGPKNLLAGLVNRVGDNLCNRGANCLGVSSRARNFNNCGRLHRCQVCAADQADRAVALSGHRGGCHFDGPILCRIMWHQ